MAGTRFARRTELNHRQMLAFMGAMAGLAALFIFFHLARRLARRFNAGTKGSSKPSALGVLSRQTRNVLLRKVPTLPSGGHAVLIFLYLAINIVITFTNIDNSGMAFNPNLASRTAWMAIANLVLVVFLALKNTPLAFITAWSYERLNILHQVAGYLTVIFVIIHASCYASFFGLAGRIERLTEPNDVFGMVAGLSFLILGFSGAVIRRWWYELFYYIHVSFWTVGIVTVGLHQPDFGKKILIVVLVLAGIWALDRLIRVSRLLVYSTNNSVTLTALPNRGTRVTLKKPPVGAVSGKHCFLWIPALRWCETHPFTIASMDPLEFVVASYDGFTQDLHNYARSHPGETLKASVEGSYGTLPDPTQYNTVVLVAGGSGASFTFGMALNMLKEMRGDEKKRIVFIWMVRHESQLTWFATQLDTLGRDDGVILRLYVTRSTQSAASQMQSIPTKIPKSSNADADAEKQAGISSVRLPSSSVSIDSTESLPYETDSVTGNGATDTANHSLAGFIQRAKPDISALIRAEIDLTPVEHRVLVLGCGPDGLMAQVRNTAASCIRAEGPGVELHCEQFGW